MIIYNPDDTVLLNIEVDDTSYAFAEVMSRDDVTLEFALAEYVNIPLGAYIEHSGRRYQMLVPANITVVNRRNYGYVATFETDQGKLRLWRIHNPVDSRVRFTLTARPSEHLAMLVANLNEREGGDVWEVAPGSYDSKEVTLSYNNTTIQDGINQLADQCQTEWEVINRGSKVYLSLGRVEYNSESPLPLSYGESGGFESGVKRTNTGGGLPIQVLYVQGGSRNIDPSTYYNRSHYLLLPRGQNNVIYSFLFDGEHFDGEAGFDASRAVSMRTDANGYSVRLADAPAGAAEASLDLSDIYPKRVGTVTAVETENSDGAYPFYDIVDDSLSTASGKLALDYNDYLIEGEQFTVVFQSGMLVGRELGVSEYMLGENGGTFKLCQETIDGFIMPGEGGYVPRVGDTYAVFGCALPAEYLHDFATKSGAEFDMLRQAARYLYENKDAKQSFVGVLSPVYARKNWTTIGPKVVLGGCVSFTDESVQADPVLMRIMAVKTYINKPYKPELTLSNEATKGTVGGSIQRINNNFAHTDRLFREEREYTNRRWRDAKEGQDMLSKAIESIEGFEDGITPVTVQTMSAIVGSNNLQYHFTDSSYSVEVDGTPYFDNAGNLVCVAGYIKHFTLGFDENDYVRSSRPASEFYRWTIARQEFALTDDGPYYVYIEASKMASAGVGTATYVLSKTPIPFIPTASGGNYDTDHYYLLLGTVSSLVGNRRSVATYYGFTEVTPGMLRAMKFISTDGQQYIDFINKTFRIGDNNTSLGWNVNNDGVLRLRGTIVQSPGGSEFPVSCYRGEYGSTISYYYGDEVVYNGESWLHVGRSVTNGVAPGTDAAVWQKRAAKGADGEAGKSAFKSIVFRRSDSKPNLPTGGDYLNPVPTGWSDGIPAPTGNQTTDTRVWVTSRIFTADALPPQQSAWSPVQPLTDTSDIDFEFSAVKDNPGTPATSPSNWHDTATSDDIWMAVRKGENGVWGAWEVTKIKGEKGDPGVSVVAQYSADGETNWHPTFVAGEDLYMRTSSDGGQTWGAAIRIVGEDGDPGSDGKPGDYTDYSFAYSPNLTSSQSDGCPTDTGTDGSEGGKITSWSDAPPAAVAGQYLWMRVIGMTYDPENPSADTAGFVRGTPSYARIGGEKGKDGIDGTDGKKGKILRGRSRWYNTGYDNNPSIPYQGEQDETGEYIDIVLYDGQTYICLMGGSNATASDPATNAYGCWQLMNNFQFIATEAIYAERIKSLQAQIDDLIVKRLETELGQSGKTSINTGNVSVSDSSGSPRINIHGTPMTDTGAGSGITRSLSAKTGTCTSEEAQIELEILSQYNSSQRIAITNSNNKVTVPGFSLSVGKTASMLNPNLGQVSIFVAFVSEEGSKPIYSVEIGVDGDSGTIPIPGRTTTLAVGTWGLKAFIGFINEEGKAGRFSATITPNQSTLTVAIQSADAISELASDGFRSVWSGEGFKATSAGAKVIQSGNEYAALAGDGGLKRVELVTSSSYPTTEEEGVLYIKVS